MLTLRNPKGRSVELESSYDILLRVDPKTERQRNGPRVAIPGELYGMINYSNERTGIQAYAFIVDPAMASLTVEGYGVFSLGSQAMEIHFSPFGTVGERVHDRMQITRALALGVEGLTGFLDALLDRNTVILGVTNAHLAVACTRLGFEIVDQDIGDNGKIKEIARDRNHVAMTASAFELEAGLQQLMASRTYARLLERAQRYTGTFIRH